MSKTQASPAPGAEVQTTSLLDQAVAATKQTAPDRTQQLLDTLTRQAMDGTVTYDRNLQVTINRAIDRIDEVMSKQLAAIIHHDKFRKLEGSWRGLHYLVQNTETSTNLKIRVLNATKRELHKDLTKASEFDQSKLFKTIYESEFGTPGGEPYGALIGDYEFSNEFEDVELLQNMASVAAASFAPFIAGAGAGLFGFDDYRELSRPRDLEKIFDTAEYTKWRSFRESSDSRFVSLAMPRVLTRQPYGPNGRRIDEFEFDEAIAYGDGQMDHGDYCWSNASFALGARLTDAFAKNGWCTAIRGAENGGKVEDLPVHLFKSDDGDTDTKCPTEIGITDRRDAELGKLGFLPLCHYKNTDYAVFFGAQTAHKPAKYDKPEATENAAISARLPYMMATSRFAHYLKVIGRDKIGSFMEAEDAERWLNNWVNNYVNANDSAGAEMRAKFPLRDAKVQVKEVPGQPGSYEAVAWLRPWLQMEELTTSLRMVARIPKAQG